MLKNREPLTPEYTRKANANYRAKNPMHNVSTEMSSLLKNYEKHGEPSIISFSRRIARDWVENNGRK